MFEWAHDKGLHYQLLFKVLSILFFDDWIINNQNTKITTKKISLLLFTVIYTLRIYCYSPSTHTVATAEASFIELQSNCVNLQQFFSTVIERYNEAEVRTHHKRDLAFAFMNTSNFLLPYCLISYHVKTLHDHHCSFSICIKMLFLAQIYNIFLFYKTFQLKDLLYEFSLHLKN